MGVEIKYGSGGRWSLQVKSLIKGVIRGQRVWVMYFILDKIHGLKPSLVMSFVKSNMEL
ncbi:hypothetical protein HanRHA438_Chr05g0223231 [Helianthus annuus]|nr:hypothetical protein HanRHA438_Chr05g0223231 [Helianthus annuus]